jgi:hypothetical protein
MNRPHLPERNTHSHAGAAQTGLQVREQNNLDAAVRGEQSWQREGARERVRERKGILVGPRAWVEFSFAGTEAIVLRESHLR